MRIDEADRLHLYEVARSHWADEGAARTLMNLLPPDRDELATKADIAAIRADLAEFQGAMRADFADFQGAMRADFAEFQGAMRADFADFRAAMRADSSDLRADFSELQVVTHADIADLRASGATDRANLRADLLARMNTMMLTMVGLWITLVALFAAAKFG